VLEEAVNVGLLDPTAGEALTAPRLGLSSATIYNLEPSGASSALLGGHSSDLPRVEGDGPNRRR
jgi:hypothetical protein